MNSKSTAREAFPFMAAMPALPIAQQPKPADPQESPKQAEEPPIAHWGYGMASIMRRLAA